MFTICLSFLPDGNSYAHVRINYEKGLLPSVLLKNRTEKCRKKYTEYHYTRYDIDKLCKLVNILSVSLLSVSIVVYFLLLLATLWLIKLYIYYFYQFTPGWNWSVLGAVPLGAV